MSGCTIKEELDGDNIANIKSIHHRHINRTLVQLFASVKSQRFKHSVFDLYLQRKKSIEKSMLSFLLMDARR